MGDFVAAFGARRQGMDAQRALKQQALDTERETFANEEIQRRQARQLLGQQAAAVAQAGTGYGGTTALVMDQSALNAELDALNIRYAGLSRAKSLRVEAKAARRQGNLMAGAYLLRGAEKAAGGGGG